MHNNKARNTLDGFSCSKKMVSEEENERKNKNKLLMI